jgi:hypothetical protein
MREVVKSKPLYVYTNKSNFKPLPQVILNRFDYFSFYV